MPKKLITTPIYYVNSDPHIGHAYTNIIAGCIKNWNVLQGDDVFLLTGTDEHGQKVQSSAEKSSKDPQDFVDYYASVFKDLGDKLNIEYDDFIRTTEERHKISVQKLWKILNDEGHIYLGKYEGWYAVRDEAFYDEAELVDGKAPTGADVEWKVEESYFFALSKFQNRLLEFYDQNPDFIIPESRKNEVVSFVSGGLKDLSISRTNFTWGITVPNDPSHVIYVWIDALTNYISALGFPDGAKYSDWWVNGDKTHVIGKDILRFHAVYWPAILMAAELPLPNHLVVHGWWTKDGQKISKSLGNVIDPCELIEKFGLEYVKYFFLANNSIFMDGDYEESRFCERINTDLNNNFGNLLSRVTNLIVKCCNGSVKMVCDSDKYNSFLIERNQFIEKYRIAMNNYRFDLAVSEVMSFSSKINKFIDDEKPWKQKDIEKLNEILFIAIDMIRVVTIALYPFTPRKVEEIIQKIGMKLDFNFPGIQKYEIPEKLNLFNKI